MDRIETHGRTLKRISLLGAFLLLFVRAFFALPPPASAGIRGNTFTIFMAVGVKDTQPTFWDGHVRVEHGELTQIKGYRFLQKEDHILSPDSWKITSRVERMLEEPNLVRQSPEGILFFGVATSPNAKFHVSTQQGDYSFELGDLSFGKQLLELNGRVRVELLPAATKLSENCRNADDFPSITVSRDGTVWAVWSSFDGTRDRIPVRRYKHGKWMGADVTVPNASGDVWRPQVAVDSANHPWVLWSGQENGNWDLYVAKFDGNRWQGPFRLTKDPAPDINQQLVADAAGNLWVVWQSFRSGNSDIYLKYFKDGSWSKDIRVTSDPADEWDPAIAVDAGGRAHIAWDTYRNGNYDVYMRSFKDGRLSSTIPVATSPQFEAHASIACDHHGRVWIAWDVGGSNWGKDRGETIRRHNVGTTLYGPRTIAVRCFVNGAAKEPVKSISDPLPEGAKNFLLSPRLLVDQQGRLWMLFLHFFSNTPASSTEPGRHLHRGWYWEQYITSYQGDAWMPPVRLPESWNRLSSRASLAAGADTLWLAWPTDNRLYDQPNFPVSNQVYVGKLRMPSAVQTPLLLDSDPAKPVSVPEEAGIHVRGAHADAEELRDVSTVRSYRVLIGGKNYRILRGDLHRHTDLSWDLGGNPDGTLEDFYRYMLDAAHMDFGATTDHMAGGGYPYWFWLTGKFADLYHVPGTFLPLFGYERSVTYPYGHRNIICAHRGFPVVPFHYKFGVHSWPGVQAKSSEVVENDTQLLYIPVRAANCIAIPHTTSDDQGTDWRDYSPAVEPVVEIYQGNRFSSEHAGAPRTATPDKEGMEHIDGEYLYLDIVPTPGKNCCDYLHMLNVSLPYRPKGFVWNAWAKGYRLGVEASSDHISTHISYTMVYVENSTRKGVMEALSQRHVYGATDNIVLDFRIGGHLMGDKFTTHDPTLKLQVKVIGTGPLAHVRFIKNGTYLYTARPKKRQANLSYVDRHPKAGLNYYYVRVEQENGELAWSSPIWVEYHP